MRKWLALTIGVAVVIITGTSFGFTTDPWTADRRHTPEAPLDVADDKVGDDAGYPDESELPATEPAKETTTTVAEDRDSSATDDGAKPDELAEPADTTPPGLVILHPVEGQVFETKEVVFEGTTEPGARVFAGSYEADVNDDGIWRIVLFLSPRGNHATLKARDAAGNISEASVSVFYEATPVEEPKDEPQEEEQPKEEPEATWEFNAYQVYGEGSESPPYDVFYGHGKPGTVIFVKSEYGSGETVVNDNGEWEIKVFFEGAPVGKGILVKVKDEFGNYQTFEFTHTD